MLMLTLLERAPLERAGLALPLQLQPSPKRSSRTRSSCASVSTRSSRNTMLPRQIQLQFQLNDLDRRVAT